MTTIAYRGGVLAGDSLVTLGDGSIYSDEYGEKISCWQTPDGGKFSSGVVVAGGSGCPGELLVIEQELRKQRMQYFACKPSEREHIGSEFVTNKDHNFMAVTEFGMLIYLGSFVPMKAELSKFMALGSGMHIAIGAMEMGASAEEAVEAACKYDSKTGGPVHSIDARSLSYFGIGGQAQFEEDRRKQMVKAMDVPFNHSKPGQAHSVSKTMEEETESYIEAYDSEEEKKKWGVF